MKAKNDDMDFKGKNERIFDAGYEHGYRAAQEAGRAEPPHPSVPLGQLAQPRNQTAFVVGVIAGLFGLWGLAHILNDKVGTGLLWMFIGGPLLLALLYGGAMMTAGVGLCLALPLHVYLVYVQAKNGANRI